MMAPVRWLAIPTPNAISRTRQSKLAEKLDDRLTDTYPGIPNQARWTASYCADAGFAYFPPNCGVIDGNFLR